MNVRRHEMAYTEVNFKTKAAIKKALANGEKIRVYQPGPFGPHVPDGTCYLEGPHYPEPHRWYATALVKGGTIIKIK